MPGILVSGAGGFIGRALTARLAGRGLPVATIGTRREAHAGHWAVAPGRWDAEEWFRVLDRVRPDTVFHLAGATTGTPETLNAVNVDLARALFTALRRIDLRPTLILAGSAAEYGDAVIDGVPVREDAPCAPLTPYGRSKLAQTEAALAFAAETGLRVLVARIFNPIGPGLPRHLALGDFANQIDRIGPEGGTLATGDIEVRRDMLHVDDLARALDALAANPAAHGVVNLCSGAPTRLRDLLEGMIAASGKAITITRDPARLRGGERRVIVGSQILLAALGAQPPPRDLRQAAADLLGEAVAQARRGILRRGLAQVEQGQDLEAREPLGQHPGLALADRPASDDRRVRESPAREMTDGYAGHGCGAHGADQAGFHRGDRVMRVGGAEDDPN